MSAHSPTNTPGDVVAPMPGVSGEETIPPPLRHPLADDVSRWLDAHPDADFDDYVFEQFWHFETPEDIAEQDRML